MLLSDALGALGSTASAFADTASALDAAADPWFALVPLIEIAGLVAFGGLLVVALRVLQRLNDLGGLIGAQGQALEQLAALVTRAAAQRGDLDLRRLEHVLIDIRDGQSRLQDALLAERRSADGVAAPGASPADPAEALVERVHNRLFALGYDRVQIVGERADVASLVEGRGSLAVEARKGGTVHKGRVLVHAGRILDVEMRPPYAMFP